MGLDFASRIRHMLDAVDHCDGASCMDAKGKDPYELYLRERNALVRSARSLSASCMTTYLRVAATDIEDRTLGEIEFRRWWEELSPFSRSCLVDQWDAMTTRTEGEIAEDVRLSRRRANGELERRR